MTDNEIVKALECCFDMQCTKCPLNYADCEERDFESLIKRAIPIFNRQKAEVENLTIELQAMRGAANSYKAEVERLEEMLDSAVSSERNVIDNIPYERAETIKEFASNLKEIFRKKLMLSSFVRSLIDDLVKEMAGEKN